MKCEKAVLNVTDIQEILGIGRNTAYNLVKSGEFPVKIIGRRILISRYVFENWLDEKEGCNKQDKTSQD